MRIFKRMRLLAAAFPIWLGLSPPAHAACADMWEWVNIACRRVVDTYRDGHNDLLLSGYAWHTPWTWTAERRAEENANAWGGGWGRSVDHDNGSTDAVYALVFSDSHRHAEYNLGYAWNTYWGPRDGLQAGLGYTAFLMSRTDIASGFPVPVVLPLGSLRYQRATLYATYIPNFNGGINHGSVFYFFGKISLQ